jgi:hypothetical protein
VKSEYAVWWICTSISEEIAASVIRIEEFKHAPVLNGWNEMLLSFQRLSFVLCVGNEGNISHHVIE